MKIALITEGISEYKSIPKILDQIRTRSGNLVLQPLLVSVPPDASPAVVARHCKPLVLLSRSRGAEMVVIVLDRESQPGAAGTLAEGIRAAVENACRPGAPVRVVLKDRMYENWLVADVAGLRAHPRRYKVTAAHENRIAPNKADRINALEMIKAMTVGTYEKVQDSGKITSSMEIGRAAQNSRSFRHFLHVLGDSVYRTQCAAPAR